VATVIAILVGLVTLDKAWPEIRKRFWKTSPILVLPTDDTPKLPSLLVRWKRLGRWQWVVFLPVLFTIVYGIYQTPDNTKLKPVVTKTLTDDNTKEKEKNDPDNSTQPQVDDPTLRRLSHIDQGNDFLEEAAAQMLLGSRAFGRHESHVNSTMILSNFDKALDCFNKALECEPDSAQTHLRLGTFYRELFITSTQLQDNRNHAEFERMTPEEREKEIAEQSKEFKNIFDCAIKHFDEAIRLNPNYFAAYCGRVYLYAIVTEFSPSYAEQVAPRNRQRRMQMDLDKIVNMFIIGEIQKQLNEKKENDFLSCLEKGRESMVSTQALQRMNWNGVVGDDDDDDKDDIVSIYTLLFENAQSHFKKALEYKPDSAKVHCK